MHYKNQISDPAETRLDSLVQFRILSNFQSSSDTFKWTACFSHHGIHAGNLTVTPTHLLVASSDELVAFLRAESSQPTITE